MEQIIHGDSLSELKKIESESIDLIFADPPYNLQLKGDLHRPNNSKVSAVDDDWDKFSSFEEYDTFSRKWLSESRRVLKKNGLIWVIGSYHNIFRVGKIMQDLGLWILNDILWIKTNPMPNFKGTRFTNAHETMILASKSEKSKPHFNYHSMKIFNDDKQMRSDWYIPIASGNERIKIDGEKAHSTQKPEELLYRVILSTSKDGDLVLDPFFGSGTTGAVAKKLNRQFIGIEREEKYINIAKERIAKVERLNSKYLSLKVETPKPKVPFGNLISSGFIEIGEDIFSDNRNFKAKVLANSSIEINELNGSIHKVSAELLKKSSNNGWDFWFVERNGELISIDKLRMEYAKQFLKG
jgi:DNA modification methylase